MEVWGLLPRRPCCSCGLQILCCAPTHQPPTIIASDKSSFTQGHWSSLLEPSHPMRKHEAGRAHLALPLPGSDGTGRQTVRPLGAQKAAGGAAACPSQHALWGKSRKVSAGMYGASPMQGGPTSAWVPQGRSQPPSPAGLVLPPHLRDGPVAPASLLFPNLLEWPPRSGIEGPVQTPPLSSSHTVFHWSGHLGKFCSHYTHTHTQLYPVLSEVPLAPHQACPLPPGNVTYLSSSPVSSIQDVWLLLHPCPQCPQQGAPRGWGLWLAHHSLPPGGSSRPILSFFSSQPSILLLTHAHKLLFPSSPPFSSLDHLTHTSDSVILSLCPPGAPITPRGELRPLSSLPPSPPSLSSSHASHLQLSQPGTPPSMSTRSWLLPRKPSLTTMCGNLSLPMSHYPDWLICHLGFPCFSDATVNFISSQVNQGVIYLQ